MPTNASFILEPPADALKTKFFPPKVGFPSDETPLGKNYQKFEIPYPLRRGPSNFRLKGEFHYYFLKQILLEGTPSILLYH